MYTILNYQIDNGDVYGLVEHMAQERAMWSKGPVKDLMVGHSPTEEQVHHRRSRFAANSRHAEGPLLRKVERAKTRSQRRRAVRAIARVCTATAEFAAAAWKL